MSVTSLPAWLWQKRRREDRKEGEREVPPFYLGFFTKKTEPGLKLKQAKTRKSSAVSCSPSFSLFPVEGGHFVAQLCSTTKFGIVFFSLFFFFLIDWKFPSQAWTFSPAETTSSDERGERGKKVEQEGSPPPPHTHTLFTLFVNFMRLSNTLLMLVMPRQ